MVWIPPVDLPTAIAAVFVAVVANSGKEWAQRVWGERRASVQQEVAWLEETIELCNQLMLIITTQRSIIKSYDELEVYDGYAGDVLKDMNLADVEYQFEIEDEDWEDLADYEEMEDWIIGNFHKHREQEKRRREAALSTEIESYYDNLINHYCTRHFSIDESVEDAYSEVISSCIVASIYGELPEEQEEKLTESAESLSEACKEEIDNRQGLSGLKYRIIS